MIRKNRLANEPLGQNKKKTKKQKENQKEEFDSSERFVEFDHLNTKCILTKKSLKQKKTNKLGKMMVSIQDIQRSSIVILLITTIAMVHGSGFGKCPNYPSMPKFNLTKVIHFCFLS